MSDKVRFFEGAEIYAADERIVLKLQKCLDGHWNLEIKDLSMEPILRVGKESDGGICFEYWRKP